MNGNWQGLYRSSKTARQCRVETRRPNPALRCISAALAATCLCALFVGSTLAAPVAHVSQAGNTFFKSMTRQHLLLPCQRRINCPPSELHLVSWNQRRRTSNQVSTAAYSLLSLPSARLALSKLAATVSFSWSGRELRTGLQELSKTFSVSIWLDRRIDPNTRIDFEVDMTGVTLWQALNQIAEQAGAKVTLIENVVYVGPAEVTNRVSKSAALLHAELSRITPGAQADGKIFAWGELSSSSEMLDDIRSNWSIRISGDVPHDLYHAGQLQMPCTLSTQLTLLLSGFDLQADLQANNSFQLKTLSSGDTWRARYLKSSLNTNAARRSSVTAIRRQFPGSKYTESGGQVELQGTTDFHIAMLIPKSRKRRTETAGEILKQRWGFEVSNHSAKGVMDYLAKQIGFQLEWAPECSRQALEQIITLKVDQASLDDILIAFNAASNLKASRAGLRVKVSPK